MNLEMLKRLSSDLESLTTLMEGAAHRADDLVTEETARAHGQRDLPGLGQPATGHGPLTTDGEELAGVPALEARIAALEAAIGSAIGALGSLSAPTPTRNARAQNILRAALGAAGETHSARSGQAAD